MILKELKQKVADARLVLNFMLTDRPAICAEEAAAPVPDDVIRAIIGMEDEIDRFLYTPEPKSRPEDETSLILQRHGFEAAYQRLAQLAKPVTAATLKATDRGPDGILRSAADRWSQKLWSVTIGTVLLALLCEMLPDYVSNFGVPPDDELAHWLNHFVYFGSGLLHRLTPFTYGCFGACVYLLRSAHQFIYRREFDLRRTSEYLNRMLLGAVSGGAAAMFVTQVNSEGNTMVSLGAPAVGFLAGYNTDLLFSSLERIIAAILPKVDLNSIRRTPLIPEPISVPMLVQALNEAKTEPDRELIRSFLTKLGDRL